MSVCRKCKQQYDGHCCKPCRKETLRKYYANPETQEKVKATARANYLKNRDKQMAYCRERYHGNKERFLAEFAKYRADNPEKMIARNAAYRAKNPEKTKLVTAAWKAKNPERLRVYNRNREAKLAGANGRLSNDLSDRLFKLQKRKMRLLRTSAWCRLSPRSHNAAFFGWY